MRNIEEHGYIIENTRKYLFQLFSFLTMHNKLHAIYSRIPRMEQTLKNSRYFPSNDCIIRDIAGNNSPRLNGGILFHGKLRGSWYLKYTALYIDHVSNITVDTVVWTTIFIQSRMERLDNTFVETRTSSLSSPPSFDIPYTTMIFVDASTKDVHK